ncbi:MAG: hypothetical protein KDC85_08820 [Saprospiraceae bacterium]|nr:hypothetical protein [Saprospiraceae bacterium]MCB9324763.1 hypothetical protein [Lewinellaceae bacterium]
MINDKMQQTTVPLFFFISLFLFTSCDPSTHYIRAIRNDTNEEIIIYFDQKGTVIKPDSVIVAPHATSEYFNTYRLGKNKLYECGPGLNEAGYKMEISNGKTLIRDFTDPNNWESETDRRHTYWKCTFVIKEEDLP